MITADLEDIKLQGTSFGHLGTCYYHLGEYEKALHFFNKKLKKIVFVESQRFTKDWNRVYKTFSKEELAKSTL